MQTNAPPVRPLSNRPMYNCQAYFEYITVNQNTVNGTAHKIIAFLLPIRCVIRPKHMVPSAAPIDDIEPTHDASAVFSAPLASGDLSDCKIGKEGEVQPMAHP